MAHRFNHLRYTTKAYGVLMAKAARLTIVEAENIVEIGEIHPDHIDLPGIYVDRIIPASTEKQIETIKTRERKYTPAEKSNSTLPTEQMIRRQRIAKRASQELQEGYYANLGAGKHPMYAVLAVLLTNTAIKVSLRWLGIIYQKGEQYGFRPKTVSWGWALILQMMKLTRRDPPSCLWYSWMNT